MIKLLKRNTNKSRTYGLDILRCLAILFVVFSHGNLILPQSISIYLELFIFDGVSLFFVLSGFLIGGILIRDMERKQSDFSLILFWKNRWFRTLPAYFLVFILLIFIDLILAGDSSFPNLWSYVFFVQNLNYPHPEWFPEAWSLSVEEWFYILMPLLLYFFNRFLKFKIENSIMIVSILVLLSVTFFRLYNFYLLKEISERNWDLIFRKQVFFRLDSLMYGVIGAFFYRYKKGIWFTYRKYFFILGIITAVINKFLIPFDSNSIYSCVFYFSLDSLATLLLLPYLNEIKTGKGLIYKAITGIALISYSMYLVNYSLVMDRILRFVSINTNNNYINFSVQYILFWSLTVSISMVIYNYCEVPMMNLRNKSNKSN